MFNQHICLKNNGLPVYDNTTTSQSIPVNLMGVARTKLLEGSVLFCKNVRPY